MSETMADESWRWIAENFERQSMMATLGARLVAVSPGEVRIEAPILPTSLQQQGFGHAALTFGIGDSASGYAALTTLPEGADVLTVEMKINLLSPAAGDRLVAVGRVIKPGRRITVTQAEIFAYIGETEKRIALMQGTMVPVTA